MTICLIGILICVCVLFLFRKKEQDILKNAVKVFGVFCLLGILLAVRENKNLLLKNGNALERNSNGEGDYEADLIFQVEGEDEEHSYQVLVPEQPLSEQELTEKIQLAKNEIDETFLGENDSINKIQSRVVLKDDYQNGKVKAAWYFDSYEYVQMDGTVKNENVDEDGEIVKASVELSLENKTEIYEFYFCVYPPKYNLPAEIDKKLKEDLIKNVKNNQNEIVNLPTEIGESEIKWKEKDSKTPEKVALLGIVAAIFVPLVEISRKKETEKERKRILQMEYSKMVSKLTLLLGSGMTLFHAWKRIATDYTMKRKNNSIGMNPLYEEMVITLREMESGIGEAKAYEQFGERCQLHRYRKFSSLLVQNLKKGTRGLHTLLEAEVEEAFEERKRLARKYGEEAGTKLLLPMMIMFGVVVFIIMVPALMAFQI